MQEPSKWELVSQNIPIRQYEFHKANQHLLITLGEDGQVLEILEWNEGCSQCVITNA